MGRTTHTYAVMEVTARTFKEIRAKLAEAGYDHAIQADGELVTLDMHGIGLRLEGDDD